MAEQKPLAYTANDWFYLKSECAKSVDDPKCAENKEAVNQLRNSADKLGSETTKYDDAKILYNRELLFTVNILAGLALIFYYMYVNKGVLLNMSNVANSVTSATSSLRGAASSMANNISMLPGK